MATTRVTRLVGRVSAIYKTDLLVDVAGMKPKFPYWMTRIRAELPKAGEPQSALSDIVAIEKGEGETWQVVQTGLEAPEGTPALPVHPVNTTLSRTLKWSGMKEVNNVGRYYATKWEAGKAARERVGRTEPAPGSR
jgi:hypothetical protein